jgi:hypothetical protein
MFSYIAFGNDKADLVGLVDKLAQIEEREANATGTYSVKLQVTSAQGRKKLGEFIVASREKHKLIAAKVEQGRYSDMILGRSPKAVFVLVKDTPEGGWKMAEGCLATNRERAAAIEREFIGVGGIFVTYPVSGFVGKGTLAEYIRNTALASELVERCKVAPEGLRFATSTGVTGEVRWSRPGELVVAKYHGEDRFPNDTILREFIREFEPGYFGGKAQLPKVRSVRYTATDQASGRVVQTIETTYYDYRDDEPPASAFEMATYGLPELPWLTPATPEPAGVPWTIYGVAAGFALLIVCILLSRRKATA